MDPSGAPGINLRPLLGPRNSSSERLKRLCILRMAGCGLRRIATLTGLERIPICRVGASHCKDPPDPWLPGIHEIDKAG
eukprot:15465433-Alexandrium_andersonii.AAC.1